MAYGTIKVDTITFTDSGVDKSVSISGLVQNPTFSGNITVTGTVSGNTIQGQTISGVTVTGTTANFTSGNFTNISGGTHTITSGVFAAGSAAAPSISFVSDPNSGLYSPGADQVAISTNGTGRLFVDAAGNVGVGTSTPDAGSMITINSGSVASYRAINGAGGFAVFGLTDITTSDGFVTCTNNLKFNVNGSERARIDSSGRLGLGTSGPSALLHLKGGASGTNLRVEGSASGDYTFFQAINPSGAEVQLSANGNTAVELRSVTNHPLDIYTNNTRVIRIDTSGHVGIGTTTVDFSQFGSNTGGVAIADIGATNTGLKISDGSYHNYLVQAGNGDFYISHYGPGSTVFSNGTSGEEAFRVDASRRLLVGTSSASTTLGALTAKFQIAGTSVFDTGISTALFENSSNPVQIQLVKSRNATTGGQTVVQANDTLGRILFGGSDGTAYQTSAWIQSEVDGTPGANDMPGRLVFSTTADGASSPTERMRIANGGNITTFTSTSSGVDLSTSSAAGTTNSILRGYYGATSITSVATLSFQVWSNGDVQNTNNSYTAISDIKLKENIVDANSQWDDIKALQVRNYNLKEGQTHKQIGLVAQEVEPISPGLVSESPDRDEEGNDLGTVTKSVNYSVLYMKAVKALQEAMERIETLEAKVAALEAA